MKEIAEDRGKMIIKVLEDPEKEQVKKSKRSGNNSV
jgi:hypothetical protein